MCEREREKKTKKNERGVVNDSDVPESAYRLIDSRHLTVNFLYFLISMQ